MKEISCKIILANLDRFQLRVIFEVVCRTKKQHMGASVTRTPVITATLKRTGYNPTMRSTAPTRMPNMEVDAESIPRIIYPAIAPIFSGM